MVMHSRFGITIATGSRLPYQIDRYGDDNDDDDDENNGTCRRSYLITSSSGHFYGKFQ